MQLDIPVYGIEGEEITLEQNVTVLVHNADEEPIHAGHIVICDMVRKSCRKLKSATKNSDAERGVVLLDRHKSEFYPGEMVRVLRRGCVYVHLETDVEAKGDPVFVNSKTGGFSGKNTAETTLLKDAYFLCGGRVGDVIALQFDLTKEACIDENHRWPRI